MISRLVEQMECTIPTKEIGSLQNNSLVGVESPTGLRGVICQDDAGQGWYRVRCVNDGFGIGAQWGCFKKNTLQCAVRACKLQGFECFSFASVEDLFRWAIRANEEEHEDTL